MDGSNMDADNQNDQDDKEEANSSLEQEQEKTECDNDITDLHMEVTEEASTMDDDDETDSYSDNDTMNADNEERDLKNIPQAVASQVASSAGGFTSLNGTSANAAGGDLFDPAQIKQEATDEDSEETEVEHDSDNETDRLPTSNELQQQLVCVLSSVGVEMPEIKEEPPEETSEDRVGQTISAPMWTPPNVSGLSHVPENVEPSTSELQSLYHECRRLATGVDNRPSANMRRRTRSQTQTKKKKSKVCVAIGPRTMCAVCNSPCRFTKNSKIPNLPVCQTCKRSYFYEQSRRKNEMEKCPNNGNCVVDYREEPCPACHLKKFQEIMKAQTRAFKGKQNARATRKAKTRQKHPMIRRNKPPVRYAEHKGKDGNLGSNSSTDSASESEDVITRRRMSNINRLSMNMTKRITRSTHSTPTSNSPAFSNLQEFSSSSAKQTLPQTSTSTARPKAHSDATNPSESSLNNMKMFIYTCEHTCSHCANSQNGQANSDQSCDTKSSFSSAEHTDIIGTAASEESLRSAILVKLNEIAQLMRAPTKTEPPVPSVAANTAPSIRFLNSKTVIDLNTSRGQPSGISSVSAVNSQVRVPQSLLSTGTSRVTAPTLQQLSTANVTTSSAQCILRSTPTGPQVQVDVQPFSQSSGLGNINLSLGPPTMLAVAPQGNSLGVGLAMSAAQPTQINLQSPRVSISAPFVALPRYLLLSNPNN